MLVKFPNGCQILSRPQSHGFHQFDAHACCGMVGCWRKHHEGIPPGMQGFDQKTKTGGFNPIIVGEQQPSSSFVHTLTALGSLGSVLIVRLDLCVLF